MITGLSFYSVNTKTLWLGYEADMVEGRMNSRCHMEVRSKGTAETFEQLQFVTIPWHIGNKIVP
jgi:hypothetical protein